MEDEHFCHQLREKEEEITGLKYIMGFLIVLVSMIVYTTTADHFTGGGQLIEYLFRLPVYFLIALVIGELNVNKRYDGVLGLLSVFALLFSIYFYPLIDVHFYLGTIPAVTAGYYVGFFYKKITSVS